MNNLSTLSLIVERIQAKNSLQKKSLEKFLCNSRQDFLEQSDKYLYSYLSFLKMKNIDLDYIVDSYLLMVEDIMIEQTRFLKTGRYRYSSIKETYDNVYSNRDYMFKYMIGVALSQFLWRNHRDMFLFFKDCINKLEGENYLEIGPGHGLFFLEAMRKGGFINYYGIDISETSLQITKEFLHYSIDKKNVNMHLILGDITKKDFNTKFDFITMGEVMEHVEQPNKLIHSVYDKLNNKGKAYISTCANSPVIDHIYLYNSVDEIREDITASGLKIIGEKVISIDNIPEEEWISRKANLSYACIVERRS